jgi:uncharacterized protein (DUF58 family)
LAQQPVAPKFLNEGGSLPASSGKATTALLPDRLMTMERQEDRIPTLFIIPLILLFVVFFLFVALLQDHFELTIFTILILSLMGGAKLWSKAALSGLRFFPKINKQKVFPGETITLQIRAENPRFLPVWLQMSLSLDSSLQPTSDEGTLKKESGLLWYEQVTFSWELVPKRRGIYPIGPLHARVGDLFGFFTGQKEAGDRLNITVYPRLVPVQPFFIPKRDFFGVPGGKSPVQDPIYILGTRDYQGWQPAKYIHWKTSARQSQLQEKVFEPSEQEKVLLVVDVSRFQGEGAAEAFERTLEIVASVAVQLDQKGYAVGLVTNGSLVAGGTPVLPVAANPGQISAILELLARLGMEEQGDLLDILKRGLDLPWGVSCVFFSYEKEETALTVEKYFSQRKIPTVFFQCGPRFVHGESEHGIKESICRLEDLGRIEGL